MRAHVRVTSPIRLLTATLLFGGLVLTALARADAPGPQTSVQTVPVAGAVARGEYLANSVAMCVQCHSARDQNGNLLESEKFRGGAIPVRSPYPDAPFAFQAPNIARLPGFTDEQVIELLTTGQASGRQPPNPPMPPFRMSRQDAEAIVAYLRSL